MQPKDAAPMLRDDHPITRIDTKIDWQCRWYHVRKDRIRLPDGGEGEFNIVQMADSVWVVPLTDNGEIVLIRNYRYPLGMWCWELPAGHIEDGQSAEAAARQELREEAGGTARDIRFLMRVATINGFSDHYGHFFLARGVTLEPPRQERAEVMTVHTLPVDEALSLARTGQMNDAVSVMALLLAEPFL